MAAGDSIIQRPGTKAKVSSVLGRDTKAYGKQNLLDMSEETCWSSDQGAPQQCTFDLVCVDEAHKDDQLSIGKVKVMFQGGFAGKECSLLIQKSKDDGGWKEISKFYPMDVNDVQEFTIPEDQDSAITANGGRLRIVFHSSSDFYGRVTVYTLDILER